MNAPDHELLERFLSTGDQPPFAELVRRHLGLVYSAAVRITNRPVLAEEVSQMVFTKLARLTSAKPGVPLIVWLHRTTRSTAIDLVRAETRRSKREEIAASLAMNESSIPWEQISPVLDQVIDGLSPDERHVVLCRYFEGQSHAEIARSLGVSEDALRMRVNRSLEKIRGLLQKRGITTTASALALVLPAHALVTTVPAGLATSITASAIASFSPSLAFIKIGIITMTKQTALITATVLLLAGAGTAVLIATKTKKPVAIAAAGTGTSGSRRQPAGDSNDSPSFKSSERPSVKKERSEAENELVSKYGEPRVKLAKRLTPILLNLIGEDGIPAIAKVMNAESKGKDMKFLTQTYGLEPEELTKVAAVYDKAQAKRQEEYQTDVTYLNSNSTALTERLLAGDALKRGIISQSEYEHIIGGIDPRVMAVGGLMESRLGNQSLISLFGEEEFVSGLKGVLDDPDRSVSIDKQIAAQAAEIAKARQPQPDTQVSLAPEQQQTLEEIEETSATMSKMVEGAKTFMNGMQSMKLLPTDSGVK